MSLKWLVRKPAAKAVLVLPLLVAIAGCSSSVYGPVGPPPADSVTFPAASTQGWLQQYGTGYVGNHSRNGDTAYGVATDLNISVSNTASYVDAAGVQHNPFQENLVVLRAEWSVGFVIGDYNAFVTYSS